MNELDYTEIQDDRIRGTVCEIMSEMLDNPDEHGIYPTSRFMWKMERFILEEIKRLQEENAQYSDYIDQEIGWESYKEWCKEEQPPETAEGE